MVELILSFFLVAHRGASALAPENTLPAFELAWQLGADAIEGDFHLTQDGHIVCIHDYDTKKVAGKKLIVAQSTLADLKKLDVGKWKGAEFTGTRIPTLTEVLATVPEGKAIYIEIKCGKEVIPILEKDLANSPVPLEKIVFISFDADFITTWKKAYPQSKALLIISHDRKHWWGLSPSANKTLALLKKTGADGLSTNTHRAINKAFITRLHKAGYEHNVWTVNDAKTAKRFQKYGSQSISTDHPGALREALKSKR